MIISGTSVQGIFTFKEGMEYEVGDIIFYGNILYSVISYYKGELPPDSSSECIPYVVNHAAKSIDDLASSDLVIASTFQLLLNSFFDGLNLRGEIDTIRTSEVDIDALTMTGAHMLKVDSIIDVASLLPSTGVTYLMRVYKSNNMLIQEVIDYSSPSIIYRTSTGIATPNWSNWRVLANTGNVGKFQSNLESFLSKIRSTIDKIKILENSPRIVYRDIEVPDNSGNLDLTNDLFKSGILLNIGFEYEQEGYRFQEFVSFDLSRVAQSTAYNTTTSSGKVVYMYKLSTDSINIQLLDVSVTNPKVIRILASEKYELV